MQLSTAKSDDLAPSDNMYAYTVFFLVDFEGFAGLRR